MVWKFSVKIANVAIEQVQDDFGEKRELFSLEPVLKEIGRASCRERV